MDRTPETMGTTSVPAPARPWLDRLGARGRHTSGLAWAALAVALSAAAVQVGLRPWLQAEAGQASRAAAAADAARLAPPPATSAEDDLARATWTALPDPGRAPADLETVVEIARTLGLVVQRAQLRRAEAPEPLRVEEIEFDVDAAYGPTRRFLARCLNRLPHASLARLRLERDTATRGDADGLRTTVTLRLHYRTDGTAR